MADDPFETVAIAYSQPQALVMLSLFEWHGIPAYGRNLEHARINCPMTLALGGIPIRVHGDYADEARDLLNEAADAPVPVKRAAPIQRANSGLSAVLLFLFFAVVPPPRISAQIVPSGG